MHSCIHHIHQLFFYELIISIFFISPECFWELHFNNCAFVNVNIFCTRTIAVEADEVVTEATDDVAAEEYDQDTACVHDVRSLETELWAPLTDIMLVTGHHWSVRLCLSQSESRTGAGSPIRELQAATQCGLDTVRVMLSPESKWWREREMVNTGRYYWLSG